MDWQEKINYLQENELSIHIEKDGQVIFESSEPMLKPLFFCLMEKREELKGATVVDKIVGRAAALLMSLGRVDKVYTPLASETAQNVLDGAGIELFSNRMIPYIVNRDKTGMCPMEKMANDSESAEAFFEKLKSVITL